MARSRRFNGKIHSRSQLLKWTARSPQIRRCISIQQAGEARSCHENGTKMLIFLIVELVDPPEMKEPQPTMSVDLQKALGAIEKGAQERMDALRSRKEQLQGANLRKRWSRN